MSIQTWKEEFSPDDVDPSLPIREQIRRDKRLFVGLHEPNLKKHDVYQDKGVILEENRRRGGFNWAEVANLCSLYPGKENAWEWECSKCPVYKVNLGHSCQELQFREALNGDGPGAMISILEKALKES